MNPDSPCTWTKGGSVSDSKLRCLPCSLIKCRATSTFIWCNFTLFFCELSYVILCLIYMYICKGIIKARICDVIQCILLYTFHMCDVSRHILALPQHTVFLGLALLVIWCFLRGCSRQNHLNHSNMRQPFFLDFCYLYLNICQARI